MVRNSKLYTAGGFGIPGFFDNATGGFGIPVFFNNAQVLKFRIFFVHEDYKFVDFSFTYLFKLIFKVAYKVE